MTDIGPERRRDRSARRDPRPATHRPGHHAGADPAHRLPPGPDVQGRRAQGRRLHLRMAPLAGHGGRADRPRHRQQAAQAEHGAVAGRPRRQDRHRGGAGAHRPPAAAPDGASRRSRRSPRSGRPASTTCRRGSPSAWPPDPALGLVAAGVATIMEAKLARGRATSPCSCSAWWRRPSTWSWRSMPASGPSGPRPPRRDSGPGSTPTPTRSSSSSRSVLGLWLIGKSIYTLVS